MAAAQADGGQVFAVGSHLLRLGEGRAGGHEGGGDLRLLVQLFPPLGQAVAVHAGDGQFPAGDLEQAAGVHRAALVGADGEKGLPDHALELLFLDAEGILRVHAGQLGEFVGGDGHDLKIAHAAGQLHQKVRVGVEADGALRHFPHDLPQEAGIEDQPSLGENIRIHLGADAGFQIVAGEGQFRPGRLKKDAFQSGDGALQSHGAGGDGDGVEQQAAVTVEFHEKPSFLRRIGEKRLF